MLHALPRSCVRRMITVSQHIRNSSSTSEVLMQVKGDKALITLNRPKALNALNLSMIRQIYPQLRQWENSSNIKAVIINGSGEKAFCAGGDIVAVTNAGKKKEKLAEEFFYEEYKLNNLIGSLKVPWIAFINGITMGGGVGLSVHGTFRICNEKTVFAMPECGIGLFPDVGGGYFLPRLAGETGTFLSLTGYRLKGTDVLHSGVATHFVHSKFNEELLETLVTAESGKEELNKIFCEFQKRSEGEMKSDFSLAPHLTKINTLFNANTVEDILKNLKEEGSDWSKKQYETIERMSPSSLKITLRLLREGKSLSLMDVLRIEYRLSQGCMANNDFYEGVRALLIDKDNKTSWKPAKLEDVTDDIVNSYFKALPENRELKFDS
ncbi:unnamed protein product [Dimorphilus gyrociliatus]|uniref:3-hydroxyisobutyryl-CoA hydrolase, mitochondrial n=1 Tax=Dimorphilus gyrociliatus TaxID=2664684 RepID=A0A7I8VA45_9ANNE|nr:unnamed protein product [Dimorphilus gyrociliatus]